MKKRFSLILILLLGMIMVLTLAACNPQGQTVVPEQVDPNITGSPNEVQTTASLKFSFPIEMSSVFNSIFIDDFDLERYVEYSVVYKDSLGAVVKEVPYGGVKEDEMVKEEDKPLLSSPGHHTIRVTATLDDDTKVNGSFELHLKDRSGALSLVDLTFGLADENRHGTAHAYFGKTNSTNNTVTVSVESGVRFESWTEFNRTFNMALSRMALQSVKTESGVELDATGKGFPITIESGMTFKTYWSDDIVNVTYKLNVPKTAGLMSGKDDPELLFKGNGKYANRTALRGVGRIAQPDDGEINVYNGYYFAGWFNEADDALWRFSQTVGQTDITLYAKWVAAEYSFTLYTMGGTFAPSLPTPRDDEGTEITLENAAELGYTVMESSSRFTLSTNELNRITFTGFHYGVDYDDYVSEVQINAEGDRVLFKFSDIYRPDGARSDIFVKGGDYLKIDELYCDYQCTRVLVRKTAVDAEQPVAYIKWVFDAPAENDERYNEIYLDRISRLYTELIYKDGYTVKADGSVRLDKISDWALSELIVPATLIIKGEVRPLTEIGELACANVKALTKVDLSGASNLTTFGVQAFALDTYLREIVMPTKNAITTIGDDAFKGTDFEDNYYTNTGGAEFIVINKKLYKYVGPDKSNIDLSYPEDYYRPDNTPNMTPLKRAEFNDELATVESIEEGAFQSCTELVSISLPNEIKSIASGAFAGLKHFTTLNLHRDSRLTSISESAFDDSSIMSRDSDLYNEECGAIIVGSVYYRFLDTNATTAVIPARNGDFAVTAIASKAFTGCEKLADVRFENEGQITSIGSEAFNETKLIRTEYQGDRYTAFNGILTTFYSPNNETEFTNLVVPARVREIAQDAFGQYARYFSTVQINSSVKLISGYAFSGAEKLRSVILPDVTASGDNLVNAPDIESSAFADTKGVMHSQLNIFFAKEVVDLLEALAGDPARARNANQITRNWLSIYQLNKSHFIVEDIDLVEIDDTMIAVKLLHKHLGEDGEEANAFIDRYGNGDDDIIDGALIITSNTGIARRAPFGWKNNDCKLTAVTEDNEYASLYEEGLNKFVLTYTYNGKTTGCPIAATDKGLFVVTVYDAIEGLPAFNRSQFYEYDGETIDMHGKNESNSMYWFEGWEGQVQNAPYPTFYTSSNRIELESKLRLVYIDIHGDRQELAPSAIYDFNPNAVNQSTLEKHASVTVDFFGMGTYVFDFSYNVAQSKFVAIEQTSPVLIPINGDAVTYFQSNSVNLIGQDGLRTAKVLNRQTFDVVAIDGNGDVKVVDTSKLGMHTMTIKYNAADTLNPNGIEYDVRYTVVLQADESLFRYSSINSYDKLACITSCTARTAQTVVVPSVCTINGEEYQIVQIGSFLDTSDGVFANFANLRSVYLPKTIQRLGVNTFAGCKRLTNIYTSIQSSATPVEISVKDEDGYFEKVGDEYKELDGQGVEWTIIPAMLKTFEGLEYENELLIGSEYLIDADAHIAYRIVSIAEGVTVNKPISRLDLYLPDTIYHQISIVDGLGYTFDSLNDNVRFYVSGSDFVFKTEDKVPEDLQEIHTGAFRGCEQLTHIDLSPATQLRYLGTGAFAETGLDTIDLSENTCLEEIDNQLFQNAALLRRVKLPDTIMSIGAYAFNGCKRLESVSGYGEDLGYIGDAAFGQCKSLTEIELFEFLRTVSANVFSSCGALTVYCHFDERLLSARGYSWNSSWKDATTPVVWNYDGVDKYVAASDELIYYVAQSGLRYALNTETMEATVVGQKFSLSGEISIPASVTVKVGGANKTFNVTAIGKNAFDGNVNITSVTITGNVKTIDAYAFKDCANLTEFKFANGNNGLKTVISTAFQNCDKLVQRPSVNTQAA